MAKQESLPPDLGWGCDGKGFRLKGLQEEAEAPHTDPHSGNAREDGEVAEEMSSEARLRAVLRLSDLKQGTQMRCLHDQRECAILRPRAHLWPLYVFWGRMLPLLCYPVLPDPLKYVVKRNQIITLTFSIKRLTS